jgi:DNA-binding CsgD family transcriptional regulator
MAARDSDQFSDIIGGIYDCAIEPDLWPETMSEICNELGGYSAGITVLDFDSHEPDAIGDRLVRDWGPRADWGRKLCDVFTSLKRIHLPYLGRQGRDIDEPIIISRDTVLAISDGTEPAYHDWAVPQGIHQVMESVALSAPRRLGLFSVTRQRDRGEFSPANITLLRRLSPHIRRAITISDLLDIKRLETQALKATLDSLRTAVIIVGADAQILHANNSAREMIENADTLGERRGRLICKLPEETQELLRVIEMSRSSEAALSGDGLGVVLSGEGGPVLATILPLARGDVRTRLMPSATAAVFINNERSMPPRIDTFGFAYDLTMSEMRVLRCLVKGGNVAEVALELNIKENTVKSHLSGIFAKTGATRQVDLIAMVASKVPPVRD